MSGGWWRAGVVGKQLLGWPGSEIIEVEPTVDYLINGPAGDGYITGGRAVLTDFLVTVRHADGRELTLGKSYEWLKDQQDHPTDTVTSSKV